MLVFESAPATATRPAPAISTYAVADILATSPEPEFEFQEVAVDVDVPALPEDSEAAPGDDAPAAGADCDLTDNVQANLLGDPAVLAALAALPRSDRSVANAVMLWDGHWVDGASPAARAALAQVRAVVRTTVAAASEPCREAPQAGPRLVSLAGAQDMVLALGSGRWRWDDLASP